MTSPTTRCCCCGAEQPAAQMFKIKMDPSLCQYTCTTGHAVCPACARRQVTARGKREGS
ncbi:MAG: hypothetical protein ACAI25_11045 [Planctomycetota bacterium]